MTVRKNIGWVNTLKLICMMFVYLNHSEIYCGTTIGVLRNVYLPLFVPAFFFISGYLIFRKQLSEPLISLGVKEWYKSELGGGKSLILNIIYKIAVPSVMFASLIYLPKKLLRGDTFELASFCFETIGGCSMWFTNALVLAELAIIVLLLTRIKNVWFYVGTGVLVATIGFVAFESGVTLLGNPNFPWFWKSSMAAVFYLTLGGLYGRYEKPVEKILNNRLIMWSVAILYICYCIFDFRVYNGGLDKSPLTIGSSILSIVGIIILICLCKKVTPTDFINYWGRYTIGLYFMCGAIPNTVAIILTKFSIGGLLEVIICSVSSFTIALVVCHILNKYLTFMFDLRLIKK